METATGMAAVFIAASVVGCSGEPEVVVGNQESSANQIATFNTYINQSIEIDQLGSTPPQDANHFVGADPADGTASAQQPTGGPTPYIDWDDLKATIQNHQLVDLDDDKGKDPSSFPLSNECVGTSSVVDKMDLAYVATANNAKYAYIAVARKKKEGDAGYYWLFTKKEPRLTPGEAPCKPAQSRLVYDITGPSASGGGDILLLGHFKPNGTPFLEVYRATQDMNNVDAVSAIDFTSGLWQKDPAGVAAVAVNTTNTAPGALGAQGIISLDNGNLEPEIFAEAAIPMTVFTSGSPCDVTFYGSIISRSSGSGGTTPDLKDFVGPALFRFGGVDIDASLSPSCDQEFGYTATATSTDGTDLTNVTCSWSFSNGMTSSSCNGTLTGVTPGSYTGTVTVTDPVTTCSKTITTESVAVYPPISVIADLTATCQSSFTYSGSVSGGSGSGFVYSWKFEGPGTITPTDTAALSGSAAVSAPGNDYTGTLTVTDPRDGLNCQGSGSDAAMPYAPLAVVLNLTGSPQQCPTMSSDAVTYSAAATGGTGVYAITWTVPGCSGAQCIIDPSDSLFCTSQSVQAMVNDSSSGLCDPASSEVETYTKVTTVTATDT